MKIKKVAQNGCLLRQIKVIIKNTKALTPTSCGECEEVDGSMADTAAQTHT